MMHLFLLIEPLVNQGVQNQDDQQFIVSIILKSQKPDKHIDT